LQQWDFEPKLDSIRRELSGVVEANSSLQEQIDAVRERIKVEADLNRTELEVNLRDTLQQACSKDMSSWGTILQAQIDGMRPEAVVSSAQSSRLQDFHVELDSMRSELKVQIDELQADGSRAGNQVCQAITDLQYLRVHFDSWKLELESLIGGMRSDIMGMESGTCQTADAIRAETSARKRLCDTLQEDFHRDMKALRSDLHAQIADMKPLVDSTKLEHLPRLFDDLQQDLHREFESHKSAMQAEIEGMKREAGTARVEDQTRFNEALQQALKQSFETDLESLSSSLQAQVGEMQRQAAACQTQVEEIQRQAAVARNEHQDVKSILAERPDVPDRRDLDSVRSTLEAKIDEIDFARIRDRDHFHDFLQQWDIDAKICSIQKEFSERLDVLSKSSSELAIPEQIVDKIVDVRHGVTEDIASISHRHDLLSSTLKAQMDVMQQQVDATSALA
jgi:hypothetical protein